MTNPRFQIFIGEADRVFFRGAIINADVSWAGREDGHFWGSINER